MRDTYYYIANYYKAFEDIALSTVRSDLLIANSGKDRELFNEITRLYGVSKRQIIPSKTAIDIAVEFLAAQEMRA